MGEYEKAAKVMLEADERDVTSTVSRFLGIL
jgi:hypothetical protein